MSDPIQNFESILKKNCTRKSLALYCDIKNETEDTCKPQDVIASVSSQLKAIQKADALKNLKRTSKSINKYKKCTVLSVNDLTTLDEEPENPTVKFDTQCITDTELIDIVENAEILDVHQGMSQEFATAFTHPNTEQQNDDTNNLDINTDRNETVNKTERLDDVIVNTVEIEFDNECNVERNGTDNDNISDRHKDKDISYKIGDDKSSVKYTGTDNDRSKIIDNIEEKLSQVLQGNNKLVKNQVEELKTYDNSDNYTQRESSSELFDQCVEIDTERPPSPVFVNKVVKIKSKSPSPLVCDLQTFENFESIAISLLESNDFKTTKQVINSQILNKELHLHIDEEIALNADNLSPVLQKKERICMKSPIVENNAETIEIDKAFSEKIINKLTGKTIETETSVDVFKDEILFSSDEDDSYIHKEYQDLPFTCALETSFYNQSDVLDKTMYVGFQTASNRSIQVGAESFAKAKTLLNDVNDEISITELVKNCDSIVKDRSGIGQRKIDFDAKSIELSPSEKDVSTNKTSDMNEGSNYKEEIAINNEVEIPLNENKFKGFMTAANKKINLSEQALARCKKVFQDIDLNDSFDCNENNKLLENINPNSNRNKVLNTENREAVIDDVLEGIDDELIKEFENIEMSLEDNKQSEKDTQSIAFKKSNNNNDKAIDIVINMIGEEEDIISQIIGSEKSRGVVKLSFKTASNKNINISKEALNKTKTVFDNIDAIELPNKTKRHNDQVKLHELDFQRPSTSEAECIGFTSANNKNIAISDHAIAQAKNIFKDIGLEGNMAETMNYDMSKKEPKVNQASTSKEFVGFKTANNKNIKISDKAWSKSKSIFDNIDSTELPEKQSKEYPTEVLHASGNSNSLNKFSSDKPVSRNDLLGFKTANNNIINISDEALAKTKTIFNDIDSTDITLPMKRNRNIQQSIHNEKMGDEFEKEMFVKEYACFKSASNKIIDVSAKALAKTRHIFKDIDPIDHSDLLLGEEENKKEVQQAGNLFTKEHSIDRINKNEFVGLKTANNKDIHISKKSFIKSKNIFNDIDDGVLKITDKCEKYCPNSDRKEFNQEIVDRHLETIPNIRGFRTASNKQIKVSDEALGKSKNIFKDIEHKEISKGEINSREKDAYPKEFFNNENNKENERSSPVFEGFQTANKKPVSVSKKALESSKKLFEDINLADANINTIKHGFSGFQTASNKQVRVSEKALAHCRNIFKDIVSNDDVDAGNLKAKQKTLYPEEILQEKPLNLEATEVFKDKQVKRGELVFKGFQTASKKSVTISKSALEKSKQLFQDINVITPRGNVFVGKCKDEESEKALIAAKTHFNKPKDFELGFQTANNKKVDVSEEALARSEKIFDDINSLEQDFTKPFNNSENRALIASDRSKTNAKRPYSDIDGDKKANINKKEKICQENDDINVIIDSQVLNNFEQSLHTEDFRDTPNNSKRSGSPILSCPRAKKRKKFETPYNTKSKEKPIELNIEVINIEKKITFRDDYKTTIKYTLKDIYDMTKNITDKIDPYVLNFKYENALNFVFDGVRNDLSKDRMTIDVFKENFANSVNAKLIPDRWMDNHLRLIIWKLVTYEIRFKSAVMCTARNVVDQLKYRYDKELYNAERSALRKIYEKDDVPSKAMVLCVLGFFANGSITTSVTNITSSIELLLTDGWYTIRCTIDKMLTELVSNGKISVGTKVVTSGAELTGCEEGVAPWEDTSAVRLKIFGNSTRRAHWDARLGYHGNAAILSELSSVKVFGGKVSKLRVFVTRVYPALYVEKFEDGSTVTRSERLENLHQMKVENERQAFMEKLYEDVEKEFAGQDSEGLSDSCRRPCMDSGSQIAKMMKKSKDPVEFRAQLDASQLRLLEAHTLKSRDRLLEDIQRRVKERVEGSGVCVNRNVVNLLKIRIVGVRQIGDRVDVAKGMMTIWKPNDAIMEIIEEGAWIDVLNVVPTAIRYSEIQLSAGRQSLFNISKYKPTENIKTQTKLLLRQCFTIKDLAQNPTIPIEYGEIDTAGLIFSIEPPIDEFDSSKQFQNVYITDGDKNIICVNFWGGLKKFGYQNVLDTRQVFVCVNLQRRAGNTRKSIPQFRVTEFSYFTQSPKNANTRVLFNDLNKKFSGTDKKKLCHDTLVLKNNYSLVKNSENVSPYRFMNVNMSKNKVFVESPLTRQNNDDNFNLTGLDFESTFRDTMSEDALQRKKKVNEKIAKLKMYGEPPPLSPIHIINRSKQASSSYKSPLLSINDNSPNNKNINENSHLNYKTRVNSKSDSCVKVASVNNSPEKCGGESEISNSPVLLNRTYVKSVNPVKINFDVNNDSNIDHFADEFDASPPLSLE